MTAVSALSTMHEDVCSVAEEKRVAIIILPFHKHGGPGDVAMDHVGPGWKGVNQRVLREAACSVGIFVDRGFGGGHQVRPGDVAHGVCVVFFGGPEDRKALELAGRMTEHPGVRVDVVRFAVGMGGGVSNGVTLRPSPEKPTDKIYSASTAAAGREREEVNFLSLSRVLEHEKIIIVKSIHDSTYEN